MKLQELVKLLGDHLAEHPEDQNKEVLMCMPAESGWNTVSPIRKHPRAYYEVTELDPVRLEIHISRVPGAMGGALTGFVSDLNGYSS